MEDKEIISICFDQKTSTFMSTSTSYPILWKELPGRVEEVDDGHKKGNAPTQLLLPEANFVLMEDNANQNNYKHVQFPVNMDADAGNYITWSVHETEMVGYEIDEVDMAWLDMVNRDRSLTGQKVIGYDKLEFLLDRLEKESSLQMVPKPGVIAENNDEQTAVCSVCYNGDSLDTNLIIFCEFCNIAVHQDCYGVPYIPDGPWICKSCLLSPSRDVKCTFCPNKGGAMKQSKDGHWGHVSCALWIPELFFSNTVFQEPIEGIQNIPASRWKLTCFVCKLKNDGACIQCTKPRCYLAFHVSCARLAGLYMEIEECMTQGGHSEIVKKTAYCNKHAPASHVQDDVVKIMRNCRQLLLEKRLESPTISTPVIDKEAISRVASAAGISDEDEFMRKIVSFWKLKRIQRYGAPLTNKLSFLRKNYGTGCANEVDANSSITKT